MGSLGPKVLGKVLILPVPLLSAQQTDSSISQVLHYKNLGKYPTKEERNGETPGVKILMKERNKLHVGKDGVLSRQSGPYTQLVLPRK